MIRCNHCPRVTLLDEAGARYRGWRLFSGQTLTGKHLDDVICPKCSGRGDVDDEELVPSWDIDCLRCGWKFSDTWDKNLVPLISPLEAADRALRHTCDPAFRFTDQGGQIWSQEKVATTVHRTLGYLTNNTPPERLSHLQRIVTLFSQSG